MQGRGTGSAEINEHLMMTDHLSSSTTLSKLEPFLLIAKSVKGAAAAKLVQDTISAQGVFVFAELLELPNVQEVMDLERVLRIDLNFTAVGENGAT